MTSVCKVLSIGILMLASDFLSGTTMAAGIDVNNTSLAVRSDVVLARDAVMPYVVSIMVVREDFLQGRTQLRISSGSGTVISQDGHVATNAHVTENGKRFKVVLADKRELAARLIGEDPISDIAVLKIDDRPAQGFEFARFAVQNTLAAGDVVLAMGAPWGMAHSLSQGVVNNPERLMISLFQDEAEYEQRLDRNQPTARYYAWIQHDASISPGNSGGPLVSLNGEIVGINTRSSFMGGDMAFAIPADVAANIVAALIKDGKVTRSFFGFGVRSLKGSGLGQGVFVSSVQQDSPAEHAGLVPGDRILAIDDKPVTVAQPEQVPLFLRALTEQPIGSNLRFSVQSLNTTRTIRIQSIENPPDLGGNIEVKAWGLTLTEVTPAISRSLLLDTPTGMLVTGVLPGKRAATAHPPLKVGDVIMAIDGQDIKNCADVSTLGVTNGARDAARILSFERSRRSMLSSLAAAEKTDDKKQLRELPKPWIGADAQPITATTSKLINGPSSGGYRVTRLYPGPAQTAGLQVGDIITALNGEIVPVLGDSGDETLQQRIRDADSAAPITVTLWRTGKSLTLPVTPGAAPDPPGLVKSEKVDWLDITVRSLGFYDRIERRLAKEAKGVVVESVEVGGLAGLTHLAAGDVILKVNGKPVTGLATFLALTDRHAQKAGEGLSFLVLRAARTRLLYLDAGWDS